MPVIKDEEPVLCGKPWPLQWPVPLGHFLQAASLHVEGLRVLVSVVFWRRAITLLSGMLGVLCLFHVGFGVSALLFLLLAYHYIQPPAPSRKQYIYRERERYTHYIILIG